MGYLTVSAGLHKVSINVSHTDAGTWAWRKVRLHCTCEHFARALQLPAQPHYAVHSDMLDAMSVITGIIGVLSIDSAMLC